MTDRGSVRVEVVYALPGEQIVLSVRLPAGANIAEVVAASGILERRPEIDLSLASVGIFGRLAPLDTRLQDRDRVEIYRPLIADAKELRRGRARKAGAVKPRRGAPA